MNEEISQKAKNIVIFIWIATVFFGFLPGLFFYLTKKEDDYIQAQAKEALNWSITTTIGLVISLILSLVTIGSFLMPIIGVCHLIFCLKAALAAWLDADFRLPFALRLVK